MRNLIWRVKRLYNTDLAKMDLHQITELLERLSEEEVEKATVLYKEWLVCSIQNRNHSFVQQANLRKQEDRARESVAILHRFMEIATDEV